MKNYIVHYYIKANRTEYKMRMTVSARNAKEACSICKETAVAKYGKNAFRPVAKAQ